MSDYGRLIVAFLRKFPKEGAWWTADIALQIRTSTVAARRELMRLERAGAGAARAPRRRVVTKHRGL